jgi:hypothetical protein
VSDFDDTAIAYKARRLVGIVGYSPVVDSYPLGRSLLDLLRRELPTGGSVAIENMTWSPLHIVQRFQDQTAMRPERLVLVGGASLSAWPGRVRAFHWKGGKLPEQAVQDRIYEAVTGVVDIENTLVIGEYFGVWPQECFVVEADMPANTFGRLVIADSESWPEDGSLERHLGFSPSRMCQEIADAVVALIADGAKARLAIEDKVATALTHDGIFMRNRFVSTQP